MKARSFAPPGWHTVIPRIVAKDARGFITFLKDVFDATGDYRKDSPSQIMIGDSLILISDAGARLKTSAFLYVYVKDTDATFRRAIANGARAVEQPLDTPYGDRRCMVKDQWGNSWQIATYRSQL
jgi:PhnB protein